MTKNIIQVGENPRKKNVENANSEEVKGFQKTDENRDLTKHRFQKTDENRAIWNNGHEFGTQYGIELTVFELMKGIRKKYPLFAQHIQYRAEDTFKAIPEIVECIVSLCDEVNSQNENPDAGMEERERQMACAKVGRQMAEDMEDEDD